MSRQRFCKNVHQKTEKIINGKEALINMDMETAINSILLNYGELAAVDRLQLEKIFNNGLQRGLSINQIYNGMRLVYGANFHQQELFSSKETAEMLALSESELLDEIQRQGIAMQQMEGNVYYFPKGV